MRRVVPSFVNIIRERLADATVLEVPEAPTLLFDQSWLHSMSMMFERSSFKLAFASQERPSSVRATVEALGNCYSEKSRAAVPHTTHENLHP